MTHDPVTLAPVGQAVRRQTHDVTTERRPDGSLLQTHAVVMTEYDPPPLCVSPARPRPPAPAPPEKLDGEGYAFLALLAAALFAFGFVLGRCL